MSVWVGHKHPVRGTRKGGDNGESRRESGRVLSRVEGRGQNLNLGHIRPLFFFCHLARSFSFYNIRPRLNAYSVVVPDCFVLCFRHFILQPTVRPHFEPMDKESPAVIFCPYTVRTLLSSVRPHVGPFNQSSFKSTQRRKLKGGSLRYRLK